MIACFIRRFQRYSLMFSETLVPTAFAIPCHRYILMDKYIQLSFIPLSLVALVSKRCPEILSVVPRTPSVIALKFLATWIPLRIIPLNYRRFSIPSCSSVSQKSSKSYSIFQKSLAAYCSWNYCLLALWLNPISIVILLAYFVIIIWVYWFNMLRMLAILSQIIEFILPAWTSFDQELFLDQSNCHQLYP